MTDALNLVQRPDPNIGPNMGEGVVNSGGYVRGPARGVLRDGDIGDLMALPGTPAYARRQEVLRQQAIARGEPQVIEVMDQPAGLILPESHPDPNLVYSSEPAVVTPPTPTKRVAIYYGRNDTFNVAVESAPDWDTEKMLKGLCENEVNLLLELTDALGVKRSDKTGEF